MISINNLRVEFGGFTLLDGVQFHINDNDRIGLVGRNGSGKSTLLKIIEGIISPTQGSVSMPNDLSIGYLAQEMEFKKEQSVIEAALEAFSQITYLEKRAKELEEMMHTREDYESDSYNKLLLEHSEIHSKLQLYNAESPIAQAHKVLFGLGFKREELERERATFSVGWNMRIELAKVLLSKPSLLLLDEPTNHLDIESIKWLEEYLEQFRGALLLISHDRRFLDRVTTRTVEIMLGKIHDYKVPYSQYKELRAERIKQQMAAYENQRKMIEKSQEFIERFRYKATKSNQVQSRIKQLDKLDIIEIDQEDNATIHLKFPPAPPSGRVVVKSNNLSMSFGEKVVFEDANITIEKGEKIALLGKNGEGKTTFMRLLSKEINPTSGEILLGHNVSLGYYAQNQEELLNKNETVFETLDNIAVGDVRNRLRDILGAFLFRGEDVDKKVSVLSGGERARLAMAKLMLNPYNLLALDEPTNHMDLLSKEVLKQALNSYEGTLILVSHDRDFLDGLVNKVYEFRDGRVREHIGTLSEFLDRKNISTLEELQESESKVTQPKLERVESQPSQGAQSYKEQKEAERELKRKRQKIEKCEEEISQIELKIEQIEVLLSGDDNTLSLPSLLEEYSQLKESLTTKLEEWEELHN